MKKKKSGISLEPEPKMQKIDVSHCLLYKIKIKYKKLTQFL